MTEACALLDSRFAHSPRLVSDEVEYSSALTKLTPLVQEHLRLTSAQLAAQANTIAQYIKAAIAAAENYTQRDIALHTRTYKFKNSEFAFKHGAAEISSFKNSAGVTVATDAYEIEEDSAVGFALTITSTDGNDYTLELSSGYDDAANYPPALVQFVLAAVGAYFEIRELANYTSTVQDASFLPLFLLDPLRIRVIA
jgi:hypothetical protein